MWITSLAKSCGALVSIAILTGCSGISQSALSGSSRDPRSPGGLFAWDPDKSAAYVNMTGQSCVQIAEVFKTTNSESSANLTSQLGGIATTGGLNPEQKVELSRIAAESASILTDRNSTNTFLSIGMFNLCMMAANGDLENSELALAVNQLLTAAVEIDRLRSSRSPTAASAPVTPVQPPAAPQRPAEPGTGSQ